MILFNFFLVFQNQFMSGRPVFKWFKMLIEVQLNLKTANDQSNKRYGLRERN